MRPNAEKSIDVLLIDQNYYRTFLPLLCPRMHKSKTRTPERYFSDSSAFIACSWSISMVSCFISL
jgi:hypothetical protein